MTHSFPTRRSSDLESDRLPVDPATARLASGHPARWSLARACAGRGRAGGGRGRGNDGAARSPGRILSDSRASGIAVQSGRSEEHTSELQSLMRISYAVFCLKKKKTTNP